MTDIAKIAFAGSAQDMSNNNIVHSGALPVVVVCGMDFEARIAEGPGVLTLYGQDREKLGRDLDVLIGRGVSGLVSFGTAGGLDPELKPGSVVVAYRVETATRGYSTDLAWSRRISSAIDARLLGLANASLYAADKPALTPNDKARIWNDTGAVAIDMESDIVGKAAVAHKLPFVVIRAVIDPSNRAIPISALKGVRDDGTSDPGAVLTSLLRRPQDIPALVRLALDSMAAQRSLLRCRQRLGPLFGLLDARQFPLDVE